MTEELIVLRCRDCGDTFPMHKGEEVSCPTCGGEDAAPAAEPLL